MTRQCSSPQRQQNGLTILTWTLTTEGLTFAAGPMTTARCAADGSCTGDESLMIMILLPGLSCPVTCTTPAKDWHIKWSLVGQMADC